MKKLLTAILLIISVYLNAFAGQEAGNGGDGVLCGDKLELFDLYESKIKKRFEIDYSQFTSDTTLLEAFTNSLNKIKKLNPSRFEKYLNWYVDFFQESNFLNQEIVDIPDSGVIFLPPGCKLVQIAAQEEPTLPGDFRYVVNNVYWSMLDNFNKAALIMHELIIREMNEQKDLVHSNTKYIRYFNQYVHSKEINSSTQMEYIGYLNKSQIEEANTSDGFLISTKNITFKSDGTVSEATLTRDNLGSYFFNMNSLLIKGNRNITLGTTIYNLNFFGLLNNMYLVKNTPPLNIHYYKKNYEISAPHFDATITYAYSKVPYTAYSGRFLHINGQGKTTVLIKTNGISTECQKGVLFNLDEEKIFCNICPECYAGN